jgi:hypothetical protein
VKVAATTVIRSGLEQMSAFASTAAVAPILAIEAAKPQALYSSDLKLRCFTPSGTSASLRMFAHVCL